MKPKDTPDPNPPEQKRMASFEKQIQPEHAEEQGTISVTRQSPTNISAPLVTGLSFEERYEFLETLGKGGMGTVLLVRDHLLDREVALKKTILPQNYLSQKQQTLLWRLQQEAVLTAKLEHPNIVPIYEMQQFPDGEIQFTMRKVQGKTLRGILNQRKENLEMWPEDKVLQIFLKVCDAVSYAHSKEIIHRDLKTENIMVGDYGEVYVMDWGIAKQKGTSKAESSILDLPQGERFHTIGGIGTLGYMPPEQQSNASQVTTQSDIYALGRILRECYTGLSPMAELRQQIQIRSQRATPLLEKESRGIPSDIVAIIEKATQTQPHHRYTTVALFSKDIESYLRHGLVSAREYNATELLLKWIKRSKKKLILTLTGSLFVGALFFYFHWEKQRARNEQFQKKIEQAFWEQQKANQIAVSPLKDKTTQISHLLNALNLLNEGLQLKPEQLQIERQRFDLGKILVEICCETGDYRLAHYVSREMQPLLSIPKKEKSEISDQVVFKENEKLRHHQTRLTYWLNVMRDPKESNLREQAIFEISKMKEDEIVHDLIRVLKEGNEYFLNEPSEENKKQEFYEFIVTVLGWIENSKASWALIDSLEQFSEQLHSVQDHQRPVKKIRYMILLAESLGNTKNSTHLARFYRLLNQMGMGSVFVLKITPSFRQLFQPSALDSLWNAGYPPEEVFFLRGVAYNINEDYSKALKEYTQSIHHNPNHLISYIHRGLCAVLLGDVALAITDLQKAIALDPQSAFAYETLGKIYDHQKQYPEAIESFSHAIHLNPNLPSTYLLRGHTKCNVEDWNGGITDFSEAIRLHPSFLDAYKLRGACYCNKKEYQKALADYNYVLSVSPKDYEVYVNRGRVKGDMGNLEGEIADYTEALKYNSQSDILYNNRASSRWDKGDLQGALSDYNEAIRLNPDKPIYYFDRGSLFSSKIRLKEAIADFTEAIRLDKNYVDAYRKRAGAYYSERRLEESLADFTKVLENSHSPSDYSNLAMIKIELGKFEEAQAFLDEALRIDPKHSRSYLARAKLKSQLGDFTGAIQDCQEGVQHEPENVAFYVILAEIKIKTNDLDGAIEECTKGYMTVPHSDIATMLVEYLLQRASAHYRQKRFEDARNDLILVKKYAPPEYPKRPQIDAMIQKIEHQLLPK